MAKRILVADDSVDFSHLLATRLTKLGYGVIEAEDGREALDLIQRDKPDLILLDYFLPSLNGDEICRSVKADGALKHIPVILLSASTAMLPPERYDAIPCDDRLTKPFEMSALLEKITRLLS